MLKRTGDFWIDLGIVAFWRQSHSSVGTVHMTNDSLVASNNELTLTLSDASLTISGRSEKTAEGFLARQVKRLRDDSWTKTRKGKWWWSGLMNFFFSQQTNPDSFLLTPHQLVVRQRAKWKIGTCDFCGSSEVKVKPAGTTENPFMVVPNKMGNFYSNLKGEILICVNCVFSTKFSPKGLFFTISIQDQRIIAFCFEASSLIALDRAYNFLSRLMVEGETYRNFRCIPSQYPMETFAVFLAQVEQEITARNELAQALGELNLVHIISMVRKGKTTSVERYYVLPNLPSLFDLTHECQWSSKGRTINALYETLRRMFFKQGRKFNTAIRESFCLELLNLRPISATVENFVYERMKESMFDGFYKISLIKLIEVYYVRFLGMDSSTIMMTRNLGEAIGSLAYKTEEKSLLFSLRSCRSHKDVLAFFEQVAIRYMDQTPPDGDLRSLLTELDQSNWREYKSLISIYAALKYSEMERKVKGA